MGRGCQKYIVVFLLLMFAAAAPGHGFAEEQKVTLDSLLNKMDQTLKLTRGQRSEIEAVAREYGNKFEALKANGVSGDLLRQRTADLRDQMDLDLEHYLTEEQLVLWKKQRAEAKEKADRPPIGNKKDVAAGAPGAPNDSGVLESAAPDKIKTSGIW